VPLEQRLRILLVEDEFIIAAMAEDMLSELGATVIGPAHTIAIALHLAKTDAIDAAVLDVNMDGEHIAPVAEVLNARGIPFIFATGYGECALDCAQKASILDKPYTQETLADALARALNVSRQSP
jgi:CheY-like chemotaxis protein